MGEVSDHWCTIAEAADLLGLSKGRVDQFVAEGRLACDVIGNVRIVKRVDVAELAKIPRPPGRPDRPTGKSK